MKYDCIELCYLLGNISSNTKFKGENITIYCFVNDLKRFVCFLPNKTLDFVIKKDSTFDDALNHCSDIYLELETDIISIEPVAIENFTVDRIEGIFYVLLADDNKTIVVDENYFDTCPIDGDVIDSNFNILKEKTKERKDAINEKFQNLLK